MVTAGPPPTQLPPDVKETPPNRSKRPSGGARAAASRQRKNLTPQIASTLMMFNLAFAVVPPLRRDQLDMVEIDALAKALNEQAQQNPRFRKVLEGALAATSGGQLVGVLAIIGARRASRHGVLPPEVDGTLGAMLSMQQNAAPPPFPMEAPVGADRNNGTTGSEAA